MKIIKLGVVGSRRRNSTKDFKKLFDVLMVYISVFGKENIIIVSCGCPKGGDAFAETLSRDLGLQIIIHKADWDTYGKGAGFKRNTYIAADSQHLVALVAEDRTGGTEDTIKKFQKFHPEGKLILL